MGRAVWQLASGAVILDSADAIRASLANEYSGHLERDLQMAFFTSVAMARTDALAKKSMILGASAQILPIFGDLSPDSASGNGGATLIAMDPEAIRRSSRPSAVRHASRAGQAPLLPMAQRYISSANARENRLVASASSTGDSSLIPIPSLVPFFLRENRTRAPTFGIEVQAMLLMMMPVSFMVSPYMEYRLGRDVYCGVTPQIGISPLGLIAGAGISASVPFWLNWFRDGYYNQDIQYNFADVTVLDVFLSPELSPAQQINYDIQSGQRVAVDTTYLNLGWLMGGVGFLRGIPVAGHASILVGTEDYLLLMGRQWSDPWDLLEGSSPMYGKLGANVQFVMPLVRNINRGRLYADNLYGRLFYDMSLYGNDEFFGSPSLSILGDADADPGNAEVFHTLGAGLDFGFIKKYLFTRTLSTAVSWEFFHQQFKFSFRILL